ncbi:integrase [Pseudanabaena sp. BC1403]|uniref:integrase n=1 Tax=Pseudanabaena sp. BC1403 TaxID=2043171 RepID=UPI000CD84B8D|nr:integrase [Pseudanabaena sp. BC1403]
MSQNEIDGRISQANGRLKAASVGVSIERQGNCLYLRGTFPPKPNSQFKTARQQKFALGVHANPLGVKLAEAEARKVGALIDCKEFSWSPYLKDAVNSVTCGDWVEKFEKDYFAKRDRNPKTQTTWTRSYWEVLKRLPSDEALSSEILKDLILRTKPDSRSRQNYAMVCNSLAKFANLDADFSLYSGNYSPRKATPRDLPTDEAIQEVYYKISNPDWQWVYGVIATYGIRPHEVFYLDFEDLPIATVTDGKTGARRVWACYPEWVETFQIKNVCLPSVTGKANVNLGERVSKAFKRYGVPFAPYDLRHCWAVRSLEFGLDISLAAQQMGHSTKVHSDLYHHWISDRHHQKAYDLLMQRADRPKPPNR